MGSLPYVAPIDMNSLPPVVIHGTNIKYVDKVKNIGVWIAPTLDWDLHVGNIKSKVYSTLKSSISTVNRPLLRWKNSFFKP